MSPEKNDPESTTDTRSITVEVLRLQLEANEKLILAAIRAHEEAELALGAQRHAEEDASRLRASEEDLRATADFRERLIGIIGHDLRNPLNTIVMAGGLLVQGGDLIEADVRLATRIVNSSQRMARLIDHLVDFTRARLGGGFKLKIAPTNLGEVCKNIAEELRISSSGEIRQTIEGDLVGAWDADRLAEAISNIAGNAVEHATPGTPVLIHAHDEGGSVVAEISNKGACIPPDVLPVIFKAFRRSNVVTKPAPGHLGLGLYIASEIVRSHGGTLDARSSDGITTFTLRLPRVSASASADSTRSFDELSEQHAPSDPR